MTDIHALKEDLGPAIMDDENVSSVGVGLDDDGDEVLVVGVKNRAQAVTLPQSLSSEDYEIREVGEFVPEVAEAAVAPQADHQSRHRPVPGGVSTGHVDVTAGTTSYLLTDGSVTYTASNAHVYADVNAGQPGDTIIQPGSADGGSDADKSATLVEAVPLENGVAVDLAWAEPATEHTTDLLDLSKPAGEPRDPEVGETVTKSGRTTAVTEGTVQQVNVTIEVSYGSAGSIRLEEQFLTDSMSSGGDSGSAVIATDDDAPVGLLFAGSSSSTAHNLATNVEMASGLSIVTGDGGGGDTTPTAEVSVTLTRQTPDTGNIKVSADDDAGNAIAGATVNISGESSDSAETDGDGVALIEGVPIGEYTIEVNAPDHDSVSVTVGPERFE